MKKKFLFGLSALFTMFVGVLCVSAAKISLPEGGKLSEGVEFCSVNGLEVTCTIPFINNSGADINLADAIKIHVKSMNGANNVNVTAASGWEIVDNGELPLGDNEEATFKIKKTDGIVAVGSTPGFVVTYNKSENPGDDCYVLYNMPIPACTPTSCSNEYSVDKDGMCYYDNSGKLVGKADFEKDCYECVSKENAYDGQYHGLNGFVVDEATYRDECEHYCKIDEDKETGAKIYYNKKGVIVTKEEYDKDCNPKTGEIANPYVLAGIGAILIGGIAVVTIKQNKLKRI